MGKAWKNEKVEVTKYIMECLRQCSDALRHVFEHAIKMTAADRELKTCTENCIRALATKCEHGISSTKPVATLGHAHAASGGPSDAVGGGGVRRN